MLPNLVPTEELGSAISLSSAQFNLGRVVGPALAGLVIVAGGYSWAFGINAASFVAVLVALCLVRLSPATRPTDRQPLRHRLLDGARATARNPGARLAVVLISVVALTASPFIALVPAVAFKAFHSKASGTSVLVTAQGIGAVLGALAQGAIADLVGIRAVTVGGALALLAVTGLVLRARVLAVPDPPKAPMATAPTTAAEPPSPTGRGERLELFGAGSPLPGDAIADLSTG